MKWKVAARSLKRGFCGCGLYTMCFDHETQFEEGVPAYVMVNEQLLRVSRTGLLGRSHNRTEPVQSGEHSLLAQQGQPCLLYSLVHRPAKLLTGDEQT